MATQSLGKYQLLKKLATGGMAEVWLARQTGIEGFNRHVVVKRILPHLAEDREFVDMFLNEARIAARLTHPNIGQIYDLGEQGGQYYIAMEFIRGEDLGRIMRRAWGTGQWIARPVALRIIADACQGLYYAHSRVDDSGRPLNIVHRDISPQNILVSFDGAVKVVDFGIAKAADQVSNTKSGAIKGKFAYMAPEQAAGKPLGARTDIFALGLVLYELLTGVRPLKRDSEIATLQAALECAIEAPSVVAEVPPELDPVVMQAIAKASDDRYKDARGFHMAIEEFLVQQGTVATSVQVSQLMEALFADRLAEEARLGAPAPSTESSTSNPVAPPSFTQPPSFQSRPSRQVPRSPAQTQSEEDDESTIAPDQPEPEPERDDEPSRVGGFELPAGTVLPSRRYLKPEQTAMARSGSRVDVTRLPPPEEDEDDDAPTRDERAEPRPRRTGLQSAPQPAKATEDSLPPVAEAPKPRRTSSNQNKRRTSTGSMPEAPPRRSKLNVAVAEEKPRGSDEGLSKIVDVKALREKQAARLKLLLVLLAVGAVAVVGFVFKDGILAALRKSSLSEGKVPILLSVTSNPRTRVSVLPPRSVKDRQGVELGDTPLERVSGAYVGDTVVLLNPDRGIRYEEVIEFGQANETHLIERVFKEATLKIRVRPAVKGASVWRNNQKLGQVGLPIRLFEGVQQLEIRADALSAPFDFEVRLAPGAVLEQEIDVSSALDKGGSQ